MGMLYPLGIKSLGDAKASLIPWMWGLNTGCSVLASVLSLYLAMSYGFTATWGVFVADLSHERRVHDADPLPPRRCLLSSSVAPLLARSTSLRIFEQQLDGLALPRSQPARKASP